MKMHQDKPKDGSVSETVRKQVPSLCALATPVGLEISEGLRNMIFHMTNDDGSRSFPERQACLAVWTVHV